MPQKKDPPVPFLDGLGRPTKRGIRKCPKCGTVNGTRGNSCKNKACDVVFRDNGSSKKSTTEACKLVTSLVGLQIFSVRLRHRGPDYRSFVQIPVPVEPPRGTPNPAGTSEPEHNEGDQGGPEAPSSAPPAFPKCFVEACIKNKTYPCVHIEATQRCFSESQPLTIKQSVISTLNIPSEQQQLLTTTLTESNEVLVQRVSKTSFVVKCAPTNKHPLGYLHIMFLRHDGGTIDKKFLCTCKPIKQVNRENESSEEAEIGAKFCMHYHTCLSAFASDDNLREEFLYFVSPMSPDCTPTLLSQLHLVTLPPPPPNPVQVEGMDGSHISVEIMQENISLLESIAAADDSTLHNVQSLEGVLSDQIIVTNVDDSLTFGEGSGLEGLEDGDSQVCQIFASAQNAIQHLTGGFSNAENVHQTVNITNAILASASPSVGKRRKHGSGDGSIDVICTIATSHPIQPLVSTNHYENSPKVIYSKGAFARSFQGTTMITYTAPITTVSTSHAAQLQSQPQELQNSPGMEEFEMWLSGVNDRLNASMNYQFTGKPDPLIYYISMDYFELLRERITTGVKKKRLPNQTLLISRTDRPPAGTFTKYVWKITNIYHVTQIFQNPRIPLKLSQYFIKGNNGVYEEWTPPPNDRDKRNQLIIPHVHSTFLKVGKNDPSSDETIPFTIEWIPDILPQSKLGELSISFEFGRCISPRDEPSSRTSRDPSKSQ